MEVPLKLTNEQPEITVLFSDKFGEVYKPFHCAVCGNVVFEYNQDFIRSIIPSGRPKIDKPGKVVQCSGALTIHGTNQLYDILFQVMEATFNVENLADLRTIVTNLSETTQNKFNTRCKAKYYLS